MANLRNLNDYETNEYGDSVRKYSEYVTLERLLSTEYPELEWLVDRIIPRFGITLISGKPSSFKTYLAIDMAIAVAKGDICLGRFETKQAKIVIIDEESGERILAKRFKQLNGQKDLPIAVKSLCGFNVEKDVDDLIHFCIAKQVGVVIMDSFVRIHKRDENSSTEINKIYAHLKKFKKNNICLIITHHNRKGLAQGNYHGNGDDLRGSGDILAFCDCHISVSKTKDNEIRISQTKLREEEERKPFLVKVIKNNDQLQFLYDRDVEEVAVNKVVQAEEKIIECLAEKTMLRQDIIRLLKNEDIGESSTEAAIKHLISKNTIGQERGAGKTLSYRLIG
jgi:RecA-family ATPase